METYLRRLYLHNKEEEESRSYPVWDYRSRRSTVSTTLTSPDGSVLSGANSSRSEVEMSESGSSVSSGSGCSDMDGVALRDPARLTLELLVDPHEVYPLLDLYDPLIAWIDPDLRLFHAGERGNRSAGVTTVRETQSVPRNSRKGILVNKHQHSSVRDSELTTNNFGYIERQSKLRNHVDDEVFVSEHARRTPVDLETTKTPPFSVILFLHEEEVHSGGRVDCVRRCLERAPWRLHHNERASRRNLNLSPKALGYFYISEDLPLWSVRQVHYGKEHVRIVVQTMVDTWEDMVEFYKRILGFEPDFLRDDFCLFTVHSQINFDIQFALKRGDCSSDSAGRPSTWQSTRLRFKVADLGRLVPLFPNVCQPISDSCWLTTDHDGNEVILDVISYGGGSSSMSSSSSSSLSSGSERGSSESCASASSSDVSFDSHDSSHSHVIEENVSSGGGDGGGGQTYPRSTLDTFRRRKSVTGVISVGLMSEEKRKSQRRVTFCLDDDTTESSSSSPLTSSRVTSKTTPSSSSPSSNECSCVSSTSYTSSSTSCQPPETMFKLRFDTCPTAPLSRNNTREEQIGFYV